MLLVWLQAAAHDDAEDDCGSDWLSAASDLADDLRELSSRADNPRALVNSTGPWLTSSELWSVASILRLCSEAPCGVEAGPVSRGGGGCGAGAGGASEIGDFSARSVQTEVRLMNDSASAVSASLQAGTVVRWLSQTAIPR